MRTNMKASQAPRLETREGTRAQRITDEQAFRRAVASCMLWEDQFYESGVLIADRIKDLSLSLKPDVVAQVARDARLHWNLRHAPLWIARALAGGDDAQRAEVPNLLADIIQRPDELTEFLALYWRDGRVPIANVVKRGLALAFPKFSAHQLAKYDRAGAIKLRDVLFLVHAKPRDDAQAKVWGQLIDGTLPAPDTWEVNLSAGKDARETWIRLLTEGKVGGLALLRNLRNMREARVPEPLVRTAILEMSTDRVLPFRFITAARYAPMLEDVLEAAMFRSLEGLPKMAGKTALVIDTSPSMWMAKVSTGSELTRFDAAAALAMLCREMCEQVSVYAFNEQAYDVPARRGFALRDALLATKGNASCGGLAVEKANADGYDRIIVLTDGQWHRLTADRRNVEWERPALDVIPKPLTEHAYLLNVASVRNSVGSGAWTSLEGWSESLLEFIRADESIVSAGLA